MKIPGGVKLALIAMTVVFVSSMTGYVFGVRAENKRNADIKRNTVQNIQEKGAEKKEVDYEISETKVVTESYIIKETEGKAGLFYKYSDGSEKLHKTYDISVNLLPKPDREALQKGIEVGSLSEALQIVEDYS